MFLVPLILAAGIPVESRITNHLIIRDYSTACLEAGQAFAKNPNEALFQLYIEALAKKGDEGQLWKVWNDHIAQFPALKQKREFLEHIAWGILNKGYASASPLIRIQALIAAYFSQDAKGVALLQRGMEDSSALIRRVSIKLAAGLRDAKLQDRVVAALKTDRNYDVRLAAIEAIGGMHIHSAKGDMLKILGQSQATPEETEAAVAALLEMTEAADRSEVERLAHHPRYGMRLLGCAVVKALESKRDTDLIEQLVEDPQPSVRASALRTLGLLRASKLQEKARMRLNDKDPTVAILAAWGLTLSSSKEGQAAFQPWITHTDPKIRQFAAAALSGTGNYGTEAQKHWMRSHPDCFVRMNLAIALISQREEVEPACSELAKVLRSSKEKWELTEEAGFKILRISQLTQDDGLDGGKEAANQLARLQVLNILAVTQYPGTFEAVRTYLKQRGWGITGMAAALLLSEGDETALDIIQELVKDEDPSVRTQAALVLALWGRSDKAVAALENSYAGSDREMREHILEGIGRVGSFSSVPFLIERMQEPYQSLRLIAAAALLECLYH